MFEDAYQFLNDRISEKLLTLIDFTSLSDNSSMLSTPEASRAVFEGPDGTLAGVTTGKSIIDCATLAESDMKRMNDQVGSKGG